MVGNTEADYSDLKGDAKHGKESTRIGEFYTLKIKGNVRSVGDCICFSMFFVCFSNYIYIYMI